MVVDWFRRNLTIRDPNPFYIMSYWEDIRLWLCEDIAIHAFTTADEFKSLHENPDDVRNLWSVVTEYQGFDVKRMIKHLHRKYSESNASTISTIVDKDIEVGGNQTHFKYQSNEPFYKEMSFLVLIFATRGSNWERILMALNGFFQNQVQF